MPRLRFTRAEAEAEAIRLATAFVASLPGAESEQCVGAVPDSMAAPSRSSKHPVAWIVIFKASQPSGVMMDGGELFIVVNLETNRVAIRD